MRIHGILVLMAFAFTKMANGQENPHRAEYQRLQKVGKGNEAADYLAKTYPEYDFKKIRGLAMHIDSGSEAPAPRGTPDHQYKYIYKYQMNILDAARVDVGKDSEAEVARKISGMWKVGDQLDILIANNTKFDVSNGSIIKFAVSKKFDEFVADLVQWKVDVNKVDATDGKTVMDYIRDDIKRNQGLANQKTLEKYYEQLRKAGGKHREELAK